jgi:hypothetical protein
MSDHYIEMSTLFVQFFALVGLFWYCWETHKLRRASQEQVKVSQKLIDASMEQVEGLSKPCVTLASELRDLKDVIYEGEAGTTQAAFDGGNFIVQNVGNGIALNISYYFVKDEAEAQPKPTGYIQNLLAHQKVTIVEFKTLLRERWKVVFEYESIGGRKYRTTLHMNNHALSAIRFERTTWPHFFQIGVHIRG